MIILRCLSFVVIVRVATSSNSLTSEVGNARKPVSTYYRSDYKYNELIKGWYKLHEIPATWSDARKRCNLETAIVMSPIDNHSMAVMTKEMLAKPEMRITFTGITSFFHYGQFVSYEAGYEYEASSADKCYKIHVTPKKWSEAYSTCAADHGDLVVIRNDSEAEIVKKYFRNKDIYKLLSDTLLVGVHSLYEKFEWLTVHGETLQEAGHGDVKVYNELHRCGGVFENGEIRAVDCDTPKPFICQKKTDLGE